MRKNERRWLAPILLAAVALLSPARAHAAGGAFFVDDSEIGKPGDCKVESWASFASNHDAVLSANPACVAGLGIPVELTGQFVRARSRDVWTTTGGVRGKINFISLDTGIGVGLSAASSWDLSTGASNNEFIYLPVSIKLSETVQLNLNAGWQRDAVAKINYATWGAGFEWRFAPKLTLLGEVFGFAGQRTEGSAVTEPRAQLGLRLTPVKDIDLDLIYGRNITGENAHWITVGLNLRF
ncbi:MAG: hypothetical protein ACR2K5_06160 [Pseudolabrys sp.]